MNEEKMTLRDQLASSFIPFVSRRNFPVKDPDELAKAWMVAAYKLADAALEVRKMDLKPEDEEE